MELDTIIQGDCLQVMKDIPDKSIQLIIADPPYFETKGKFDFIWESFEAYLKDVEKWALACKRVLAENGTMFWFGSSKRIAYTQVILDKHFNLVNNLVWNKGSFLGLEESEGLRSFAPCTERILMYGNNNIDDYNEWKGQATIQIKKYLQSIITNKELQQILLKNNICSNKASAITVAASKLNLKTTRHDFISEKIYNLINKPKKSYRKLLDIYNNALNQYEELRRPFSNKYNLQEILNFSNEAQKTGAKYNHDTVKPIALYTALIETCSREGDTVLDPMCGSGTTAVVCKRFNRKFVCIDIDPDYCEIGRKRLKKERNMFEKL